MPHSITRCNFVCPRLAIVVATLFIAGPTRAETEFDVERHGLKLLMEEKWQLASEQFGTNCLAMDRGVKQAWKDSESLEPAARERFRLWLITFYFRNVDFPRLNWSWCVPNIEQYCREDRRLRMIVPSSEQPPALDFSHLELLSAIEHVRQSPPKAATLEQKAIIALETNPHSIPAGAALLGALFVRNQPVSPDDMVRARKLLQSPWGKLNLVRAVRDSYSVECREVFRDILRDGWELAPSDAQRAELLYKYAEAQSELTGGKEAFVVARRVIEEFPNTFDAVRARSLAISIVLKASGPEKALTFVQRLKERDPTHTDGLELTRLDLAKACITKRAFEVAKTALGEVVGQKNDRSASVRGMLMFTELYAESGDLERELYWLRRCAMLPQFAWTDPIASEVERVRSAALPKLAEHLELLGEWEQAYRAWELWQPMDFCGTCAELKKGRREKHRASCLEHIKAARLAK